MKLRDQWTRLDIARGVALAAAIFSVMMLGLLACTTAMGKVSTLVNSKEVVRLHDDLRKSPKDEALKAKIRRLDLQLRRQTFFRLQLSHHGGRALLAGAAVFLAASHRVRTLRRIPPDPTRWGARDENAGRQSARFARYAVATAGALVAFAGVLASLDPVQLPALAKADPAGGAAAEPPFPSVEEFRKQWPSFRGAQGSGMASDASPPLSWDAKAGTNVKWKSPVPLHGMSSPVIWSNHLFLTGADKLSNCVCAFDTESGRPLWTRAVKVPGGVRAPDPNAGEETSFAAPTAVTDGRRVAAIFANGEIAAFDFEGRQLWARNIGPVENAYGYASSLALHQDLVFVQIDRGAEDEGLSKILALELKTGRERWLAKREVGGSWASPVVVEIAGQPTLLACAAPMIVAYDPATGVEKWRNRCLESDVAPSPVLAGNVLVVVAPNNSVMGISPGATNVLWKAEDGVPDATSPVTDGRRVFNVSSEGLLTCVDAQTGKVIWQHEYEDRFYASPTLAGDKIVLISRKGVAHIIEAADGLKQAGKGEFGEEVCASPVPRGGRLYVRGVKNLFCLEQEGRK